MRLLGTARFYKHFIQAMSLLGTVSSTLRLHDQVEVGFLLQTEEFDMTIAKLEPCAMFDVFAM